MSKASLTFHTDSVTLVVMNIYDMIERAHLDRADLLPNDRYLIAGSYTPDQWIRAAGVFLKGIGKTHSVPGRTVNILWGIRHTWFESGSITHKQKLFLANNIIDHWDQLDYATRSQVVC
jgi:hypothetical protein